MSGFPDSSSSALNNNNNNSPRIPNPINIHQMYNYNQQRPAATSFLPDRSQNSSSFGKRTIHDYFQAHHFQQQQQQQHNTLLLRHLQQQQLQGIGNGIGIGPFSMRSVKPRIYQNPSHNDLLLPEAVGSVFNINNNSSAYVGRYAAAACQLRPEYTIGYGTGSVVPTPGGFDSYNHNLIQNGLVVVPPEKSTTDSTATTEKRMIMNRLQELEKQLLDDDVDDEDASGGDSVSVITGNEWTATIQNLLDATPPPQQQQQDQINTSSPTSSSSSCSSTVASPLPICHIQLITEAATAIADGKLESATEIVTRVSQSANPRGTTDQRLAYYMSLSLKSKMNPVGGQNSASSTRNEEHSESVQLLYHHSNCFKLGFLAANLATIEATSDAKSLHLVDLGFGDGKQYQTLLQFLSLRKSGKPTSVKITAVDVLESGAVDEDRSRIALERLSQLSERVGIPLVVKSVRMNKVGDLTRESLSSNEEEVLAVNMACVLSKLPDESVSTENQRDELLRKVKGLNARIVTVVEQEMNCNTAPFQTRVAECCSFFGALFDSFAGREDSDRIRVEEGLGRVMMNTVSFEGDERIERCEVFGKWRARMGMAGFDIKPLSQNVVESLSLRIVNSVSGGDGGKLFVKEINGGVGFGWMGRIVTVTSAWR